MITGMLHRAGAAIGEDLVGANSSNPRGHWEDVEGLRINDRILHESGGSWKRPPATIRTGILSKFLMRRFLWRNTRCGAPTVWKDPRTVLTLPVWRPLLRRPIYIGAFRRAESVAASLEKRGDLSADAGLVLWLEYNRRILAFAEEEPVVMINFDGGPEQLTAKVNQIAVAAGLPGTEESSFDPALRRSDRGSGASTPEVEETYRKLMALSGSSEG